MEALLATFVLGLGSAASPCLLPLYPGFIAYLAGAGGASPAGAAGERKAIGALLGLAVLFGVLATMLAAGIALTLLALPFGDVVRWTTPAATLVLVALGFLLVAGRNPFAALAGVRVPKVSNPLGQSFVYGVLVGPVALPCAGPFLVALLAISVGLPDTLSRIGTFVAYGLGFGLPLVALAAIGAARGRAVSRAIGRYHESILRVAGVFLIATAAFQFAAGGFI